MGKYKDDMAKVTKLIDEMKKKFFVANPVGKSGFTSIGDTLQIEVRTELAGPGAGPLQINKVPINAAFYEKLGEKIEQNKNTAPKIYLKCFDFVGYMFYKLKQDGFKGKIHVGMIGKEVRSGHVFLVLYKGERGKKDNEKETYLDYWSAMQHQDAPSAMCAPEEYGNLLPQDRSMQNLLKNGGVSSNVELKNATS